MELEEATSLCHDWLLEFVCHDMWNKFKSGSIVDQELLDLSNGVLLIQKYRNNESFKRRETMFLILTSSLMSLRKSLITGERRPVQQADLQSILRMVRDLTAVCDSEAVTKRATQACMKTLEQRILDLCHCNQYDDAQNLFEEVINDLNRDFCRKMKAILSAKNRPYQYLKDDSLEDYLSIMTKYLEAVYDTFPDQPVLLKQAYYYLTKGAEYKGVRSEYSSSQIDGGADREEQLSQGEEQDLQNRLMTIRKRNFQAAALFVDNDRSSHGSQTDDAAADGTRGISRHPDISPRKRQAMRDDSKGGRITDKPSRCSANSPTRSPSSSHQHSAYSSPEQRSPLKKGVAGRSDARTAIRPVSRGRGRSSSEEASSEDSNSKLSVSSVSAGEEHNEESESEEDQRRTSLRQRVTEKIKVFRKRQSLSLRHCRNSLLSSRQRSKWTRREEEEFYLAVQKCGVGNWQAIRSILKTGRTNVQLKDKWRNINYEEFKLQYGPVRH